MGANDMIVKIILYSWILFIFSEWSAPARAGARARRARRTCALHPQHNQSLLAMIIARRVGYNPIRNLALIASRGPKRNSTYDPHYGYEPYWAGGEWVYKPYRVAKHICGTYKCGLLYTQYGEICARNNKNEERSFNNYCDMLAIDCNGTAGWILLNKGNCSTDIKTHPIEVTEILNNVPVYLDDYKTRIQTFRDKMEVEKLLKQKIKDMKNKQIKARPVPGSNIL